MEGGCHCGEVRYRLDREPIFVNACHCRDCQKLTGSAFAVNAMIERSALTPIKGAPATDTEGCDRCPRCGVLLWATHPMFGASILFLRAGTLDRAEEIAPDAHFFTRSRHPWVTLPPGVPSFETLPGPGETLFDDTARARVAAARGGG